MRRRAAPMDATTTTRNASLAAPANANGHGEAHEAPASPPRRARTRTIFVIAGVVVAVLAIFLVLGIVFRLKRDQGLATAANAVATTPPRVPVNHARPSATADPTPP